MAGVILISFALLGLAFITLSYRYTVSERQGSLRHNASYIATVAGEAITSSEELGGFSMKAALFRPTVEAVTEITDANVLFTMPDGQILYASSSAGELSEYVDRYVPNGAVQTIYTVGFFGAMSDLGGLYGEKQYVAGAPVTIPTQSGRQVVALVFVSAEMGRLTEMWRAFSNIFLFAAIIVMLVAFITSSFTSLQMTRPLKDMAVAVRKFGHGEYDTRIACGERRDEVGELAEAFNSMADNIAQSEARRSEFVANISHELKTPMTTISGFTEGILDGTIPPDREKEYLKVIAGETKRLARLVRKMLDLSRLQSAEYVTPQERFDISEVMLRVLVSLETKINAKHLDVDTQIPEDPVDVWGDPDAITQVCYNLLDNAIKFATADSTLVITMTTRVGKAHVSVRNQGDTVPPEELDLIFDRFHKTDHSRSEDREGVGLGLYIVKTILNNHHENIAVTSQDGITEFIFTLTLA